MVEPSAIMALALARYTAALAVAAIIAGWAHAVGVTCLLGFIALGFLAVAPADLAAAESPRT